MDAKTSAENVMRPKNSMACDDGLVTIAGTTR